MTTRNHLMIWQAQWAIGIDCIDDQHRYLVSLIDQLYGAIVAGEDKAILARTLCDLIAYADLHFHAEEEMMRMNDYPGLEAHAEEHRSFLMQVQTFQHQFAAGLRLSMDVVRFMSEWLRNHILGSDRKYVPYLMPVGN